MENQLRQLPSIHPCTVDTEANGTDGGGTGTSTIEKDIKHSISSLILGGRNMSPQTFPLLTFCYASTISMTNFTAETEYDNRLYINSARMNGR